MSHAVCVFHLKNVVEHPAFYLATQILRHHEKGGLKGGPEPGALLSRLACCLLSSHAYCHTFHSSCRRTTAWDRDSFLPPCLCIALTHPSDFSSKVTSSVKLSLLSWTEPVSLFHIPGAPAFTTPATTFVCICYKHVLWVGFE